MAFVISGLLTAGYVIGTIKFILDLAPPEQRPTYVGFTNTFLAPFCLAYLAAGWMVAAWGYTPFMLLCSGLGLVCFGLAVTMKTTPPARKQ